MQEINIGESELEIMKALWKSKEPMNSVEIGKIVEERKWKKTTIATFLTRLTEKGAISAEKRGKLYYYMPLISQREYRRSQTGNLIESLYNGSVKEFAVSLFSEQKLSEQDIKELRAIFADKEE